MCSTLIGFELLHKNSLLFRILMLMILWAIASTIHDVELFPHQRFLLLVLFIFSSTNSYFFFNWKGCWELLQFVLRSRSCSKDVSDSYPTELKINICTYPLWSCVQFFRFVCFVRTLITLNNQKQGCPFSCISMFMWTVL